MASPPWSTLATTSVDAAFGAASFSSTAFGAAASVVTPSRGWVLNGSVFLLLIASMGISCSSAATFRTSVISFVSRVSCCIWDPSFPASLFIGFDASFNVSFSAAVWFVWFVWFVSQICSMLLVMLSSVDGISDSSVGATLSTSLKFCDAGGISASNALYESFRFFITCSPSVWFVKWSVSVSFGSSSLRLSSCACVI